MSREYVLQPFRQPVELKINYGAELNEQQYAAVTSVPCPALVIAGAGSGKTRTLTYRVAYLLEQGIPPDRILLLTFTNKAAREMMRRVADVLTHDITTLWGGTFHSIGNRILRRHADRAGYRPDFTILDREDAKDLLKACMDAAQIPITETRFPKPEVLVDVFSMAVNTQRSIAAILEDQYPYFARLTPDIESIQNQFTAKKRAANVMDFDDLLVLWLRLLKDHPDIGELYQRRFQFVLVDEYQDTNKVQSDLIDLLVARHKNLMVVGDDSQSIYSWRGANFKNILEFPKRYPGAQVFKIETNYRSTPEILAVANAVIAGNVHQFAKALAASRKSNARPVVAACGDGGQQAAFVAQRALELRDEGVSLNDIAVLYRSHFHALELQLELTKRNIPFSITSGIRFFEQAHIKDVTAHLKLLVNPDDELSFKRIVRLLPGVGGKASDKLWLTFQTAFAENRPTLPPTQTPTETQPQPYDQDQTIPAPRTPHSIARALQACSGAVPKKTAVAWAQFTATIAQLEQLPPPEKPDARIRLILEAGYEDYLKENFANYRARAEDLEQLAVFSAQFNSLDEFLSQLALLTNLEADDDKQARSDSEQIRLSTIHQAKGLEFSAVFVIMLCEGLFPSARSLEQPESEEEERRLFYVAVTRAKNELYLSFPLIRMNPGYGGDVLQQPSRFIKEIPVALLDEWNLRPFHPYS